MEQKQLTGYPSIDKPWLKYYSEEAINAPIPECTIYKYIWDKNKDYLSDTALEYYGHRITYEKMFDETERCAKALKHFGVQKGEIIAAVVSAFPETVFLLLAASKIGAIVNFINPMFETTQKIDRINDTSAKMLFVMDAMYPYISEVVQQTCIQCIVTIPAINSFPVLTRRIDSLTKVFSKRVRLSLNSTQSHMDWRVFLQSGKNYIANTEAEYERNAPVLMVYSSGTTGAAKGIMLSNAGINATAAQYERMGSDLERGRAFLSIVPVWFSTGIVVCIMAPLSYGVKCILEPVFGAEQFSKAMLKYKPNYTLAATSIWLKYIETARKKHIDLSHIRQPIIGGEQLLPRTEILMNRLLSDCGSPAKIQTAWAMCELGATGSMYAGKHGKIGAVGLPLPLLTISAFNQETNIELQYEQRGELRVVSPCRMVEYYKNPAATEAFFHIDSSGKAWACTGDMGYVDEDGFVYILGRASDFYLAPGGDKVYLFDVENVILQEEAVDQCEAVAISVNGQAVPVAHIVLRQDCTESRDVIIARIDARCRQALPAHAVPQGYKLRGSFAIKPSGKRDAEALKAERGGFVDAEGRAVDFAVTNEGGRG